jgi:CubicO group peptidase (beta-lactamase class C family)
MLRKHFRQLQRLAAMAAGALNLPRPPAHPERISENWDYLREHMHWFIRRALARSGVPALSIALVDDSRVIWSEGFGFADRERRIPATSRTVYQIGSITKVLNAIAFLRFVDAGRVALDAPLTQVIPEFSMRTRWPQARPITLRALLCHHAGLPTYYLKGFFSSQSLESLLAELRNEHLAYEPHTVFNYSNLGPNLLGLVLERQYGKSYPQVMQELLFGPLGMTHSSFAASDAVRSQLATGYVHDEPVQPTPIRDLPAGGVYSSVEDIARFMRAMLAGGALDGERVISDASLNESLTPQYTDCELDFGQRYGLGWILSGLPVENSGRQAWHNGGTKAYLSQMALLPDRKLGVVVLTNSDRANHLVYNVSEEALQFALEIRHGQPRPSKVRVPEIEVPRAELEKHVGDYSLMGSLSRISLGRKRLQLQLLNYRFNLVPVGGGLFRVEYDLLGLKSVPIPFPPIDFVTVQNRRFAILRDRVLVPAEFIPPYTIPDAWHARLGNQHLLNPDKEFLVDLEHCRLEVAGERLLMDVRISGLDNREIKAVIVPLNDHEAYVFGQARNVGDVVTATEQAGTHYVRYSGYDFEVQKNQLIH